MLFDDAYDDGKELLLPEEKELLDGARYGDLALINELIEENVNINAVDDKLRSALHLAAGQGHDPVVRELFSAGATIDTGDMYGMNALLWAAWFGHLETMKTLVELGADEKAHNKQGLTIIHCAAAQGHVDVLKYIQRELIKEDGFDDENSFLDSVGGKVSNLLGGAGKFIGFGKKDEGENSSSLFGLGKGRPETSAFEAKTTKGSKTPLHIAAEHGHVEALEYLIKAKCNTNAKTGDGSSALHLAAKSGNVDVAMILLEKEININCMNGDGKTPLHVAAEEGKDMVVAALLEKKANGNCRAKESLKFMAPVHLAVRNNHTNVIQALYAHGSDMDTKCDGGNTPLHLASYLGMVEAVEVLIDCKANVNLRNDKERTPLHDAVENGFLDIVELLLVAGAKVHVADKLKKSPLMMATRAESVTITDMIIKAERYYDRLKKRKEEINGQRPRSFRHERTTQQKQMKPYCYDLAMKELEEKDLKRLLFHWGFTQTHIDAIQSQYIGNRSWREHMYRVLLIWLHGCDENPLKELYEALVSTGRKKLADRLRHKANKLASKQGANSCSMS